MSEIKLSVMRAFGSEQFSTTITLDKAASAQDIKDSIALLNLSTKEAFDAVLAREEEEKLKLTAASKKREENNKMLESQLKNEMDAAGKAKQVVAKAEKENKRANYK